MSLKIVSYLIFLFIGYSRSAVLPVGKCHLEDSSCMIPAFQKAVPIFFGGINELGVSVQDPMEMEDVEFEISGLQFSTKKSQLIGLKSAIIDNVKWDLKKKNFKVNYHLDCVMTGHYIAAGRILVLPITGDGDMKISLKNLHMQVIISYEIEKGSDGKDHVTPKKLDFEFDVKDNANFYLGNLFNGNKELSEAMLHFLNENWQQVSKEFGRPLIQSAVKTIFKNCATFFKKNAIEELADM